VKTRCSAVAEQHQEREQRESSVAIDGSKFKPVNNRDKNSKSNVQRRRAQLEESIARYLSQIDTADRQEPTEYR